MLFEETNQIVKISHSKWHQQLLPAIDREEKQLCLKHETPEVYTLAVPYANVTHPPRNHTPPCAVSPGRGLHRGIAGPIDRSVACLGWRSRALGKQEWRGDRLVSAGQSWGVLGEISDTEESQGCQCLQRQIGNDMRCMCEGRVQPSLMAWSLPACGTGGSIGVDGWQDIDM